MRNKGYWFALLSPLFLFSCTKIVYLPHDAGYYFEELEQCKKDNEKCIDNLEDVLDTGEEMRRYVPPELDQGESAGNEMRFPTLFQKLPNGIPAESAVIDSDPFGQGIE